MRVESTPDPSGGPGRSSSDTVWGLVLRYLILFAIDGFGFWFIFNLFIDGAVPFAIAFILILALVNIVLLRQQFYPLRWMLIGLVLMAMLAIYPIIFTVYVAFTNFGDGNLLTKERAIEQLENQRYLPEGGESYSWTAFRSEEGEFVLWLQLEGESGRLVAPTGTEPPPESAVGPLDGEGIPESVEGYQRLNRLQLVQYINTLGETTFGEAPNIAQVESLDRASVLEQRYVYDSDLDAMVDQETGVVYTAEEGTFTSPEGEELIPGFQAVIGLDNFTRFFTSPALQGPLVRITIWNFAFATLSVLSTFALGLFIALLYNDPKFPGRKIIQSFLLIPYTIPSLITILIWRGMLNRELGVVSRMLADLFGSAPPWFTDPWWAKIAILLINLWLGYPYFMLICSGALQAIPKDIYSAAEVDGANAWQRFWRLTLPLLLVAVGPLLVASFTFNFNNFNVIFLFNAGGPPISGTPTPAGHTDILISYVYDLAFAGGRGADYGLASAITIVIFFIVAIITLFQFRYTQMWEEIGENV